MTRVSKTDGRGSCWDDDGLRAFDCLIQHSSYYHRRFQGYMETLTSGVSGRKRIEQVYIGNCYTQVMAGKTRLLTKAFYVALYSLSMVLFLFASSADTPGNDALMVQFISFLTISSSLFLLVCLAAYLMSPSRMTVWQYTAGPVRIRRWSKLAALLMAVQALASFAAAILHGDANLPSEAVNAAICLFASLGMYWIHRTEAGIVYEQSPSGNEAPRDGYYIDA